MNPPAARGESKSWRFKKQSLHEELEELQARSPVLKVLESDDRPGMFRALLLLGVPTLVAPERDEVRLSGPVVAVVSYTESMVTTPPLPWSVVTVLEPANFYHGNSWMGGLCIGDVPAGTSMEAIVHQLFAAVTLQSANTIDWEGMDPSASDFIRRHAACWPVVETGLFEDPGDDFRCSLDAPLSTLREVGR
ncbi:MAG: hypothetical protein O7J95_20555 [Planctomycetota bacterium]|nr:hypothetical protein [Planctomycetota bacterium]